MKIKTNNIPRHIVHGFELPENQRKEFDYLSDEEYTNNEFFEYKSQFYDLGEFMRCEGELKEKGWQGYSADSYFSGIVVKYTDDDSVIVGTYYC
jgi:hypothetical protein